MSWRDRLEPASFRGVTFFVNGQSARKGRRVSVRRLAGKDGSRQQDHGRNEDAFSVTAFLFGDDFDLERNDLEEALLQPGPAELHLPTRGTLWVTVVGDIEVTQSKNEGGYCSVRFSVVVEDRAGKGLKVSVSTPNLLKKNALALKDAGKTDFGSIFDVAAMPGKYITTVTSALSNVTQNLRGIQGKINGTLNPLEDLTASINSFDDAINDLMNTPDALASRLTGLVYSVFGLADTAATAIDRSTGLSTASGTPFELAASVRTTHSVSKDMNGLGGDSPEDGATELADRSAKNVRAVYRLARAAAVARQAETYAAAPFDSANFALTVLESAMDEVDDLQAFSPDDDLFQALADMRMALSRHLATTAASLPKAVTRKQHPAIPAILLAHVLYGDARLESEIVARNRSPHPLFLEGEIEVLQ